MVTVRFLIERFGGKPLLAVLVSILLLTTALSGVSLSQANNKDRTETVREMAKAFIERGTEQYELGRYLEAERSLLRALDYREYLTAATREELNELLEKAHAAVVERKRILEHIRAAEKLIKQDQLIEARLHLEEVKGSEVLSGDERGQIAEGLKKLDAQLDKHKKQIAELYNRSVAFYEAGELEKAREGFAKIARNGFLTAPGGKTAADYLAKIDSQLRAGTKPSTLTKAKGPDEVPESVAAPVKEKLPVGPESGVEARPKVVEVRGPKEIAAEPVTGGSSYIQGVIRKRSQRGNYVRIVVTDANNEAQRYIGDGRFDKAKEEVEFAERVVNEFRLDLGENLFRQYSMQLKGLSDEIARKEDEKARELANIRQKAVEDAQRDYREKTARDKRKRIADLMKNARDYQKKQRYEEAHGQLEMLLALDPLDNDALILKQTLDDMISFRRALEIEKEAGRERVETLLETERSGIPHGQVLTYPTTWPQIAAKRRPDKAIGQDPRDAAVYSQLEEVVDLTALGPDMTFSDAIEELKRAVKPALQIVVFWRDLIDNADIDQTTPINMDPIPSAPLGTALELLLKSVSGGVADLGYVVEKGVITIATVDALPSKLVTRVYDVTVLLGQPANFYGSGMGMGMGMGGMGYGGYGGGGYGGGGYGGGGYGGGGYGGGGYGGGGYGGGGYGRGGYGGGGYGGGYGGGGYGGGGYGRGGYGGGGRGGYGGGGYGGGGMGYGMGGMGYGMGGMGSMGYGMGSMGMMGDPGQEYREFDLITLIMNTVEPDSWYETGTGEGTITSYEGKKLIILQTPEIHKKIEKLLSEMRKALGHQVSIEARYLTVSENFLEDIGLDLDLRYRLGGKWTMLDIRQGSSEGVMPSGTKVPGTLAGTVSGMDITGGYGAILDDLQVSFLIRMTEAHKDSKTLTAPKVTVLSGESASLTVQTDTVIALPPEVGSTVFPGGISGPGTTESIIPTLDIISTGTTLNVTPIITPDKKHVLLNIVTTLNDFLGMKTYNLETPLPGGGVAKYKQELPETEISEVMTRVSMPDGGTLLLGGQKVTAESETEVGVPIIGKMPIIGRLFRNRSKIKDHKVLLILVKPTIILQEERDAEAIAAPAGEW